MNKLSLTAVLASAITNDWLMPYMPYLKRRTPPKVYDTPSFLKLMRAATTRDVMNDILETARVSKANPRTLRRLGRAYDQRLKELGLV